MKRILETLKLLFISARPLQWIKNIALYAPLVFSGFLFYNPIDGLPYFIIVTQAFLIFCLLTSSIYLINDVLDIKSDQKHPIKKDRPIAAGKLSPSTAIFSAFIGLSIVFYLSQAFSPFFQLIILGYAGLQLLYSFKLKYLPILDILTIASGFLLRIYAGSLAVNLHMSVWFLLTVVSASLFLAVGKRQSERTLMQDKSKNLTRATLDKYSQRLLDVYTSMFANATWLTYALFTFQSQPVDIDPAIERFTQLYTVLPRTLQSQKLLMLTLPFVIFGVMRYLALIYEENKGESPEKVLIKDKTLLSIVFSFIVFSIFIIYFD
ncbi:MAG: UbiA prenyltransferase [Microgenomates bacterium 39_7]|nr:MAG: UbiA prenyltransferase [Microgenomates bacterium 39_7]